MTLNGVIALILFFFSPNSIALEADYVTVVEDKLIMSAKYRFPVIFGQHCPTQQSHVTVSLRQLASFLSTGTFKHFYR